MSDDTWSQDWSHGGAQLKTSLSTGHSGYAAIYYNMALLAALHYRQDRADSQGSAANGQWDILLCKCTRLWSCQSCAATTANYIQVTWLVDTLVRSATARGVPWQVLLQHSIMLQCYLWVSLLRCERYSFFWSLSVVSCPFSARCMYSTFGHHPQPLGYLCTVPNFVSFAASIAELAHAKNHLLNQSITHSVTQSLNQLIWCRGNRSACSSESHHLM